MKMNDKVRSTCVVLYAVVAIFLVWSLDAICAVLVSTDSAWQALDANGQSRAHLLAEAIHQIPMLGMLFSTATVILLSLYFRRKRTDGQNNHKQGIREELAKP